MTKTIRNAKRKSRKRVNPKQRQSRKKQLHNLKGLGATNWRKITLGMVVTLLCCCGCQFNRNGSIVAQWKATMSELQMTPIVPLRERIELGEVYRYQEHPPSFYKDVQMEPSAAFKINIDTEPRRQELVFPTIHLKGNTNMDLGTPILNFARLNLTLGALKEIEVYLQSVYSEQIYADDVRRAFLEKNEDGEMVIKEDYHKSFDRLANLYSMEREEERELDAIYLRIPFEVYYVKKIIVTIKAEHIFDLYLGQANNVIEESNLGRIEMTYNTESEITLREDLGVTGKAVGYKGLLFKVSKENYIVREFEENLN
jgi:hypothetical protein